MAAFSPSEAADLRARALPVAPVSACALEDVEGAVLVGAGVYSRTLLATLEPRGIRPAWIVDSNPQRWGSELDGVPIRAPGSLYEAGDRLVIAMTHHFRAMADILGDHRVPRWAWFTSIGEVFGNYDLVARPDEVLHHPEVDRLLGVMAHSGESGEVLRKALACRITGSPDDFPPVTAAQYFQEDLVPRSRYLRFVDCGAYVGDTLLEWMRRVGGNDPALLRYHAIEPDARSFEQLAQTRDSLPVAVQSCVSLHRCGVGSVSGRLRVLSSGVGTNLRDGPEDGSEVDVTRLDDLLVGETVTAIKMDLEGFEPRALEGARALIAAQRPVLLVAIYHQVRHLWELPLWIHDLGLGYRLSLRHHDASMSETVCYGVPE